MPLLAVLRRPTWRLAIAIAVLALVPLLAPVGKAQALDPQAQVATADAAVSLGPGSTATTTWTVTNAGDLDATAAVSLSSPAGWSATLAPADRSFTLAAGASRTLSVPVSPGGDRPADAALTLAATMTDAFGRTSPQAVASSQLTFVPPPVPPPPRDYTAEIVAGVLGGLAFVALAAFAVVYVRRSRQVALYVDAVQRPVTSGTDGIFLVQVENRGRVRREVELRVEGLPSTWYGAFSFPKVQLQPGERSPVPLCIKVPFEAKDGEGVDVVLHARPGRRFPWLVRQVTRIEAHDRVVIGPGRHGPAIPAGAPPAAPPASPAPAPATTAAGGRPVTTTDADPATPPPRPKRRTGKARAPRPSA